MKQKFLFLFGLVYLIFAMNAVALAGTIYQNFEPNNGTPAVSWSLADRHEAVHLGLYSLKISAGTYWSVTPVIPQVSSGMMDIKQDNNDRLTFWIYSLPQRACYIYGCERGSNNTVAVIFYDNAHYAVDGFEVWTNQDALYQQWTKLGVEFTQLPADFDLRHVTQIAFKNYLPGKYYLDDIHAVREDRVYQSFNQEFRGGSAVSDYGWKWNDADTVALSSDGEPVLEGGHSWKMILTGKWAGAGIQSQQQTYFVNTLGQVEQSYWHNNLYPENNDRLSLWVYGLPENGMDTNLSVQFYDHGLHATDTTKVEAWTKTAGRVGQWTRLEVLFRDLPADLNLRNIDKLQIQNYWAGTFYIDDIRATGPHPVIKESLLAQGMVSWDAIAGAQNYRLMQSTDGPYGPWVTVYSGPQTKYKFVRLSKSWFKVRWEEKFRNRNSLPYSSPWSNVVEYHSPDVVLNYNSLAAGLLAWNTIAQAGIYEVQFASDPSGPWLQLYKGPAPSLPITAVFEKWYRVRAVMENAGTVVDAGVWSRPQVYSAPGTGFIRASGTSLKDHDGTGTEVVFTGFNLGNYLLTEDWMTGFGLADDPKISDDWTLRDVLTKRFGMAQTENLLRTFENAYLNTFDFDQLRANNVTLVRLPIFYRNLMDDQGNFILDSKGQTDFFQIDRIVNAMADRGIYTLLDLHGAPGSQSAEFHTGRKNFNKLFEAGSSADVYRARTEKLWREIAKHYKMNKWVLGYDLLNEPVGAPNPSVLADFYNRLYLAIRAVDSNHVIVMEGIWDWETLPNPIVYNWKNVMYQFHYYCPMIAQPVHVGDPVPVMGESCADYGTMASRLAYQQAFINAKIANSRQILYNVPVMVGEFNAYDHKEAWETYLQAFNAQKWNWTVWSYKDRSSPSSWGIFNHANFDEALPKFRAVEANGSSGDSYTDLLRKVSKFATADYHVVNGKLQEILEGHAIIPPYYQTISTPVMAAQALGEVANKSLNVDADGTFLFAGQGMCDTPGKVEYYPYRCDDVPAGSIACNKGDAAVTFWSETLIKGVVPPDYSPGTFGGAKIHCEYGGELYPTMIPENRAPILDSIANRVIIEGQHLGFRITASDPDGDALIYSVTGLPGGALLRDQRFDWTPGYAQAGNYDVTFRVSDGFLTDEKTITITVIDKPLPDYIVTDLSGPTTGDIGATISVKYTIKNQGQASGKQVNVGVYLSADPLITTGDLQISNRAISSLASGASSLVSAAIMIPAYLASGTYYLGAIVDYNNDYLESDENNNVLLGNPISFVPGADLVMTAVSGPALALPGAVITINSTVANLGKGTSAPFYVGVYLSTDNVITTSDSLLGRRQVGSLPGGATNSNPLKVFLSANLPKGSYYVGAIADYLQLCTEKNESNNSFAGNVVVIKLK